MRFYVPIALMCIVLIGASTTYGADKKEKEKAKPKAKEEVECCGNDGEAKSATVSPNQTCAIFPLYPLEPDEPGQEKYVYYALYYEGCSDQEPDPDYLVGYYYWEALCDSGYCVEARLAAEKGSSSCNRNDGPFEGMDGKVAGNFEILDRDGVQERAFEIPKGPARKSSRPVNFPRKYLKFTPFGQDTPQTFRIYGIDRATKKDKGAPEDEEDIIYVAYQTTENNPARAQQAEVVALEKIRTTDFAYRVTAVVKPNDAPVKILVLLAK